MGLSSSKPQDGKTTDCDTRCGTHTHFVQETGTCELDEDVNKLVSASMNVNMPNENTINIFCNSQNDSLMIKEERVIPAGLDTKRGIVRVQCVPEDKIDVSFGLEPSSESSNLESITTQPALAYFY